MRAKIRHFYGCIRYDCNRIRYGADAYPGPSRPSQYLQLVPQSLLKGAQKRNNRSVSIPPSVRPFAAPPPELIYETLAKGGNTFLPALTLRRPRPRTGGPSSIAVDASKFTPPITSNHPCKCGLQTVNINSRLLTASCQSQRTDLGSVYSGLLHVGTWIFSSFLQSVPVHSAGWSLLR